MRILHVLVLLSSACATVPRYEEAEDCPIQMTEEQHRSGVVRCTALCSSYARDFASFDADCKCRCMPAGGVKKRSSPSAPVLDRT